MPYLKASLPENQPVIVRITERFAPTEGQYGPKFPYKIVMNGTGYDHDATMTEEKGLQKFQVGQEAQVTKKLNSYGKHSLFWNEVPRGAPAMNQDAPVYSTQTPPPKPLPAKPETDWDAINNSKIIFGYMIAYIGQGKTPEEAQTLAIKCHKLQEQAVTVISTGIPSVPSQHNPETVKTVAELFGNDQSVPLEYQ